jgi:hypothetical protein
VHRPLDARYHCPSIREPEWTVDWAGNEAINLHRVASIELLHLALDFYEHTGDTAEFTETILPLAIGVTDFVDSYYDRTAGGELRIWPTQSLEGYRPGAFPPTDDNTIHNDMPWVAGLHAVLPRLIAVAVENSVSAEQKAKWQDILSALPPLPVVVVPTYHNATVFTAAQEPYPPHAILGGSEQPEMYAIHPYVRTMSCAVDVHTSVLCYAMLCVWRGVRPRPLTPGPPAPAMRVVGSGCRQRW